MDDQDISDKIERLEAERERLRRAESEEPAPDNARSRLQEITVELDQAWDLLRQRRALRAAGSDPDDAAERAADTVEGYWQ